MANFPSTYATPSANPSSPNASWQTTEAKQPEKKMKYTQMQDPRTPARKPIPIFETWIDGWMDGLALFFYLINILFLSRDFPKKQC